MSSIATTVSSEAYLYSLYQIQVFKYFRVAPISIWVLEFLLTLPDEVRLWSGEGRWGITHVLYIPTRYFPVLSALCIAYNIMVPTRPVTTCVVLYKTAEVSSILGMTASEGLLLIRVLALWNTKRSTRMFLIGLYTILAIIMLACFVTSMTLDFRNFCEDVSTSAAAVLTTKLSRIMAGIFACITCFELVMVYYTLLHEFRLHKQTGGRSTSRLVTTLTQGNLVYTLTLLAISIVNITFYTLPPQDGWAGLFSNFFIILHGVMAARILFSLRDAFPEGLQLQIFTRPRGEGYISRPQCYFYE